MPNQSQLELAKQGDPQAIANVINNSLKAKNINADVCREDNSLHIMLEGDAVPNNQQSLVTFVRNGMTKLDVPSIYTVKIYGRQLGDDPAWEEEIVLKEPPPKAIDPEDDMIPPDVGDIEDDFSEQDTLLDQDDHIDDYVVDDDDIDPDYIDDDQDIDDDDQGGYIPEEDDDPDDDDDDDDEDKTQEVQPSHPKSNKVLLLIPIVLLVAIAALAGLHFAGIFSLPFLPGGSSEMTTDPDPADTAEPTDPETPQTAEPTDPETPQTAEPAAPPTVPTDPWRDGINAAMNAATLAQTAQSQAEWNAVASEWQKASELMSQVPQDSENYQAAQERVGQYAENQRIAQQRATTAP
ncbi:MAG: hypothetical protein P5702_05930 [Limnospira sp. PMC 1291.21]|uniref:Uncharacterized protein n=3 Tax=Limnospira TaxID=2596745 RepID=A0A9P1KEU0_9CYAN|nr:MULTISPECIES: hypothetical protein [Limnospira]MDC0838124.1 hypothetical protein [Limnoraphis robusta]QJB27497.1 hypothetical protein HFV01_19045 [Limnospira fusiformis SAG 85.79]EDZ93041.1 conserved hypothetical protein [Limnospira maxima CS-328]MDT9179031.1 hypothetical protein [Limnospira sp. PMC 1238.20]MDT9186981.1 hypothetical protein [Limnospira sp. PMC 894.15]